MSCQNIRFKTLDLFLILQIVDIAQDEFVIIIYVTGLPRKEAYVITLLHPSVLPLVVKTFLTMSTKGPKARHVSKKELQFVYNRN